MERAKNRPLRSAPATDITRLVELPYTLAAIMALT